MVATIIDHDDLLAFARFDDDGGPQQSNRPSKTPPPDHRDAAAGVRARLSLAPALYQGTLDGGWWPRSLDVVAELTALVAALPARVGPVDRVSLNLRYLMWRVTAAVLDVPLLALGVLASWPFRPRRPSNGRGWTANASTPPGSEGLFLVPYWGLPR